jgi:hypothetical protein
MRTASWINALVAGLLFLLSLAPYTPAVAAFAGCLPVAVATARRGAALPSLLTAFFFALAIAFSPVPLPALLQWPSVLWLLALSLGALYIVVEALRRE